MTHLSFFLFAASISRIAGYGSQIRFHCLIWAKTVTSVNDNSYGVLVTPGSNLFLE